jgi:ribosomal-protein-alanine N-acetyltransferase
MKWEQRTEVESIETEPLELREWNESDFDAFTHYYSAKEDARYVGGQKDADQAWRHMTLQIGHWKLKGFGYWAVDEKDTNDFVGCVGLRQSPGWPELELGYWIIKKHQYDFYERPSTK